MRTLALCVVTLAVQPSLCFAQTNPKPETPHLRFVNEYIRELSAYERIREAGEKERNQDVKDGKLPFSGAVHTSTLFQLELGSQIRMLRGMSLDDPFDQLIPNITAFYEDRIALWQRMSEISSAFIGSPKPGVDYDKLAAEMPQIRAKLDYIDQSLFQATPAVFATLIDMKADSKGHANHLIITKEEKADLISELDTAFGKKLEEKDQNYIVSSASVLKGYLNKDFKCADEPWD